jgi:hypothetical protein
LQYELLVDKYARQAHRKPEYELRTFYGQVQNVYAIQFPVPCEDLGFMNAPFTIILAAIRNCVVEEASSQLRNLDIQYYSTDGALHVVDVTSVQCLVGRIRDRNKWAIIDRSGSLVRALYTELEDKT